MNNPFPNGILLPPGRSQGDSTLLGFNMSTILPSNNRNPEYHSWNFSIQRELPWQSVLELNYTGSRGTHLFMPVTTLSPLPQQYWSLGRTYLQEQVPNPFFGQITDPRSLLSGRTVQRFRLLRPFPRTGRLIFAPIVLSIEQLGCTADQALLYVQMLYVTRITFEHEFPPE
jgi:hypothetical protein